MEDLIMEKMYECRCKIRAGYEVAKISQKKYWTLFRIVGNNWDNLIKQSRETKISIADLIFYKYKTSYAVGADIANSIALSKAIG